MVKACPHTTNQYTLSLRLLLDEVDDIRMDDLPMDEMVIKIGEMVLDYAGGMAVTKERCEECDRRYECIAGEVLLHIPQLVDLFDKALESSYDSGYDEGKSNGYDEGYDEGYDVGYDEGSEND